MTGPGGPFPSSLILSPEEREFQTAKKMANGTGAGRFKIATPVVPEGTAGARGRAAIVAQATEPEFWHDLGNWALGVNSANFGEGAGAYGIQAVGTQGGELIIFDITIRDAVPGPGFMYMNQATRWDPATNTYHHNVPSNVAGQSQPGYGQIGDIIYLAASDLGGFSGNRVIAFDAASMTWITGLAPHPVNGISGQGCASGGKVYLFGAGAPGPTDYFTTFRYDPVANAWATLGALPANHFGLHALKLDDDTIFWGGVEVGTSRFHHYIYNPSTDTHTLTAQSPAGDFTWYDASTLINGVVYLTGSTSGGGTWGATYTPATDTWGALAAPGSAMVPADGGYRPHAVVIGGIGYYVFDRWNDVYHLMQLAV